MDRLDNIVAFLEVGHAIAPRLDSKGAKRNRSRTEVLRQLRVGRLRRHLRPRKHRQLPGVDLHKAREPAGVAFLVILQQYFANSETFTDN